MDDAGDDAKLARWMELGRRMLAIDEPWFDATLAAHRAEVDAIASPVANIAVSSLRR